MLEPINAHIEAIIKRLKEARIPFKANDNISDILRPGEDKVIQDAVEEAFDQVLRALVIDTEGDHNTQETAKRVAKMYVQEVFRGRYAPRPAITDFPNAKAYEGMYISGPITIRSACSHHLVPIIGKCWIGVIPGTRVIGLSKFNRIVEWIASRPQIQEELAVQIADQLEYEMDAKGVAVVIKATHMCMTWRGVKESMNSTMTTSVMRGLLLDDTQARNEFLSLIKD